MMRSFFSLMESPPGSASLPGRFNRFTDLLVPYFGDWVRSEIVFGITGLQLILSLAILLATLVTATIVRWLLRREPTAGKAAAIAPGAGPVAPMTIRLILDVIRPPALLLIWAWGLSESLYVLLYHLESDPDLSWVIFLLKGLRVALSYAALFWGLFRLVVMLEMKINRSTTRTSARWEGVLARVGIRALRLVLPLLGILIVIPTLQVQSTYHDFLKQAASLLLIGGVGFILYELTTTTEQAVLAEFRIDVKDNLAGRKIQTQVRVLRRITVVLILLVTVALMLMVFDPVRQLGKSILASAGIAGIILGFAAQRSLATLVAGIQIAFTQPIRIDDVVIVEGEWGRIEEITMSYVVVVIWDLRRLIVPITYFIEKPFQNWTRVSANLLGTVMLYVDYTVPRDALRAELDRILEHSRLWDRKVKALQVTDAKEQTLELRVLVSAGDASDTFDLRCEVREKLVDFLQRNYPQCLPRLRAEMYSPNGNNHDSAGFGRARNQNDLTTVP